MSSITVNESKPALVIGPRRLSQKLSTFKNWSWLLEVACPVLTTYLTVDPDTLTDIQHSARFYYLQQNCFGGKITGPTFGYAATRAPKLNLLRIEEQLSAAHLRLSRVYVECLPYMEIIRRYDKPETFFYLDPPYWDCEDYYGKGIFSREDFAQLATQLGNVQGKFILSLNDTPGVRETFSRFRFEEVVVNYTCSKGKNLKAGEVLITNF